LLDVFLLNLKKMATMEVETQQVQKKQVLVLGGINGNFNMAASFLQKASKVPALKDLELVFCVGNFFGDGTQFLPFASGEKKWPFPTFFICGKETFTAPLKGLSQGGSVAANLHYLGAQGITSIKGLTVAFLSGCFDENLSNRPGRNLDVYDGAYSRTEIMRTFQNSGRKVDILLTCEWPTGCAKLLTKPADFKLDLQPIIARVATDVAPHYHFVTSPKFMKFKPFVNSTVPHESWVTSLGNFSAQKTQRHYAFRIFALESLAQERYNTLQPVENAERFPYRRKASTKRKGTKRKYQEFAGEDGFLRYDRSATFFKQQHDPKDLPVGYVCARCKGTDHFVASCKMRESRIKTNCWFCWMTSVFSSHLVIWENPHIYCALSKGNMIEEQFLIAAKQHSSSVNTFNKDFATECVKMLLKLVSPNVLIVVDRRYGTNVNSHDFWECFSISRQQIEQFKEILRSESTQRGLRFGYLDEALNPKDVTKRNRHHLMFSFPHSGERLVSVFSEKIASKLNARWHTHLISRTLNVENVSWKTSKKTLQDETVAAQALKAKLHEKLERFSAAKKTTV